MKIEVHLKVLDDDGIVMGHDALGSGTITKEDYRARLCKILEVYKRSVMLGKMDHLKEGNDG